MSFNLQQSITFKVLGIGFLALLMLIPLSDVQGLIRERSALRYQAVATIAQRWGAQQQLGGPVLVVSRRVRVQTDKGWEVRDDGREAILADQLIIDGSMEPEQRSYGIYDTTVYTAQIKLSGKFLRRDLKRADLIKDSGVDELVWSLAELRLPVSDARGIRRASALRFGGQELNLTPAGDKLGGVSALAVPVDLSALAQENTQPDQGDDYPFELTLTLAGTQSLSLLPLARHTEAALRAAWPNPSFDGAFLPAERHVDQQNFEAHWQVLDLNRSYGQFWRMDVPNAPGIATSAFGVSLYQPASLYQQNERAGKYGVLFIALTFVAFFLFEVLRKLRVHPVQYLLIGVALTTFYLVLLALSEQVGFSWAYLAAAAAVVALIGGYATAVLRARRAGALLATMLALVYALLYGLVVSEQYSLLIGAIALLGVVSALMYLTRKVDWSMAATAA